MKFIGIALIILQAAVAVLAAPVPDSGAALVKDAVCLCVSR